MLRAAIVLALALAPRLPGAAQQKPGPATEPAERAQLPTITFTLNWAQARPSFFKLEMDSTGSATYESQTAGEKEPYWETFTLSPAMRQRIFRLAAQARYFHGNFEFRGKVAQTGAKTLAYADDSRRFETRYNWSENHAIAELTQIFTGVSTTVEAGRELRQRMRYDMLGVNDELGKIQQASESGIMLELGILAPALNQIATGSEYMKIARQRAQHLLALVTAEGSAARSESRK